MAGLVVRQHGVGVGLALGGVGGGDGVDDGLGLLVADLLVVVYDIAQVVSAGVVGASHAHGVVGEVDIAVVAWWVVSLVVKDRGRERGGWSRSRFATGATDRRLGDVLVI